MKINGNLSFLGLGQIENLRVENLATDPLSPAAGQIWFNTTDGVYRGYDSVLEEVITFASGGNTETLLAEINTIETAVGLQSDGTLATIADKNYINGSATILAALIALDAQAKTSADAIAAEVTRATGAEGTLTTNLAAEVTRATTAEGTLTTDLAAEVTRATGAEGTLTTNLAAEVTRATGEEASIRTDFAAADTTLQSNIDAKVSKAGDTMSGQLAMDGNKIIGVGAPTAAGDAANKNYVDNLLAGLTWESAVDEMVANQFARSSSPTDGFRTYAESEKKIYTYTMSVGWDNGEDLVDGAAFFDKSTETGYVYSGTTLVQFTGGGQLAAGIGLSKTGNQLDVNLGAGIAQLPTDEVGVDVLGTGGLFLTVDGTAASTDAGAQLAVKLDGTSLTRSADGIKVSDTLATAVSDNTAAIAAEVTRATGAEGTLTTNLAAEVTRATTAEGTLTTDLAAEVTRATGAEGTLTTNLAAEVTRATTAEGTLTTNLAAEVTAREDADQAIIDNVAAGYHLYTSGAANTSHVVTHNIGSQFCNVTVVDSTNQVVIPQSITFDSTSQLTVTFNTSITCKIVVMGLKVVA